MGNYFPIFKLNYDLIPGVDFVIISLIQEVKLYVSTDLTPGYPNRNICTGDRHTGEHVMRCLGGLLDCGLVDTSNLMIIKKKFKIHHRKIQGRVIKQKTFRLLYHLYT